jgi:glycosyltransferase involved in cell wall biosynthesis
MISVVIVTLNSQSDLVAALAPLVPASMDGLVRDLVIADGGSVDQTLEIAEEAGATIVSGGRAQGIAAAKGPWILLMTPTARLTPAWIDLAKDHMTRFPDRTGAFVKRGWFAKTDAYLVPKPLADRDRHGGVKVMRL